MDKGVARSDEGLDERIDEGCFPAVRHVERMENDKIAKKVYVGEWVGSLSVDRSQKRWIDTMKDCLKKRSLDIRQARRMVHDRSEWRGFARVNDDLDEIPQVWVATVI